MSKRERKGKRIIFIPILLFTLLILSIFVYFNYEMVEKNLIRNNASEETNLTQKENGTKSFQENVSIEVPEEVVRIGKKGKIKIVS